MKRDANEEWTKEERKVESESKKNGRTQETQFHWNCFLLLLLLLSCWVSPSPIPHFTLTQTQFIHSPTQIKRTEKKIILKWTVICADNTPTAHTAHTPEIETKAESTEAYMYNTFASK